MSAIDAGALDSGINIFTTERGLLVQTRVVSEIGDIVTILPIIEKALILRLVEEDPPVAVARNERIEEEYGIYKMVGSADDGGIMQGEYTRLLKTLACEHE